MKSFLLTIVILIAAQNNLYSQASGRVELFAHLDKRHGGNNTFYSGCWGWTNPVDNREYGIIGCINGTSIIDVTNSDSVKEVAFIAGPSSGWREAKTWSHYAYVVVDASPGADSGVHIIDLSQLPDTAMLVKRFNYNRNGDNIRRSHEIFIDENGIMYLLGSQNWGNSGVIMFSLADPINPQYVGEYQPEYIHDAFARNDTLFAAAIYGTGIYIVDVHNKANPNHFATIQYPNAGTHNVWTTDDGRYLFSTDEIGQTAKTLKAWDITNLPAYSMTDEYTPNPAAIVHNVMIRGKYAYISWYTQGLVIADISDPTNITTVGTYDSYPGADGGYNGAWGIYAFESGKAIISDRQTGTYICTIAPTTPNQVLLVSPANRSLVTDSLVTFRWRASTPSVSSYWLEYSTDSAFSNSIIDSTISDTIKTIELTNQNYYWRVKAKNNDGWGPFSIIWNFHFPIVGVNETEIVENIFQLLQNYPNPFNPQTTLSFIATQNSVVTLKVFNILGEEVATLLNNKFVFKGVHTYVFDGRHLESGIYFTHLTAGTNIQIQKIVLQK